MRAGVDLVFPPECASCRLPLSEHSGMMLCSDCRAEFVASASCCPRCAAVAAPVNDGCACVQCQNRRLFFESVVRLGTYDNVLRAAVLRSKHDRQTGLAGALAELLMDARKEQIVAGGPEVVVPVPMHWSRRLWRGVDSAHAIASRLAARLRVPLAPHLLIRRRRTALQAQLSPRRRRVNVRRAFRVGADRDLPGARILLVDDVMTTGATVNEAAKTLVHAGAGSVRVAVLARASGLV